MKMQLLYRHKKHHYKDNINVIYIEKRGRKPEETDTAVCMQRKKTSAKLQGCGSTERERNPSGKNSATSERRLNGFGISVWSRLKFFKNLRVSDKGTEHWLRYVWYLQIKHCILYNIPTAQKIHWQECIKSATEDWIYCSITTLFYMPKTEQPTQTY